MTDSLLDLYTNYLSVSFSYATATGLSNLQSLKSNAAFAKSPARTPRAQSNHLFSSIVVVFKLEKLKISTKLNHFALKSKRYIKAIKTAFDELQIMKTA